MIKGSIDGPVGENKTLVKDGEILSKEENVADVPRRDLEEVLNGLKAMLEITRIKSKARKTQLTEYQTAIRRKNTIIGGLIKYIQQAEMILRAYEQELGESKGVIKSLELKNYGFESKLKELYRELEKAYGPRNEQHDITGIKTNPNRLKEVRSYLSLLKGKKVLIVDLPQSGGRILQENLKEVSKDKISASYFGVNDWEQGIRKDVCEVVIGLYDNATRHIFEQVKAVCHYHSITLIPVDTRGLPLVENVAITIRYYTINLGRQI